ncbi:MAG: ROK family protein [Acidobacteria bacterium]|nr:ROK family protein [Acidobacteriota bacterium]
MTGSLPANGNYIGVDVSGVTLRAALVSNAGEVVQRREAPLEREAVAAQIAGIVAELRDAAGIVAALGVGIPGLVNRQTDRVLVSTDLPHLVRGNLHTELMEATGLRVELENDANAGAYGEYQVGAGRGSRDMFYITIGMGIGGAIILDGKPWLGASGFAGEFGHITIDTEGIECVCGNTGCLETVASAPNIVRRTHERLYRDSTSSLSKLAVNKDFTAADIAREARAGDDFALMMVERTGKYIGAAVASVINLLNLERIVLGGGVMEAGDLILNPIIREAGRRAFQPCFEATQIVAAALGTDSVSIGAALLARDAATTMTR